MKSQLDTSLKLSAVNFIVIKHSLYKHARIINGLHQTVHVSCDFFFQIFTLHICQCWTSKGAPGAVL